MAENNNEEAPENYLEDLSNVLDEKELVEIDQLAKRYQEMTSPGFFTKVGKAFSDMLPDKLKEAIAEGGKNISEQEFYLKAMDVIATGFGALEEQAARFTITEEAVINEAKQNPLS